MKLKTTLLFIFCTLTAFGQNKTYDFCYQTGPDSFSLYSIADGKAYELFNPRSRASYACLSPDGKKVAYSFTPSGHGISSLAIIDLNTKRKTVLNTHNADCAEPIWSPDGKFIAYRPWNEKEKKREIAIITVDNKFKKVLTGKLPEMWNISWTSDSKRIVTNDLDSIFVLDLSGELVNTYKVSDIVKTKWCNSFRFTPDGKKFVFLRHVDETVNTTGGSQAVCVYDFANKKTLRVSPKDYDFHNIIIRGNQILASGEKGSGVPNSGIYSIDLDGKNFRLFFPKASNITVKN